MRVKVSRSASGRGLPRAGSHRRRLDVGSAVDFAYRLPFEFTGEIDKVTTELT